MHFENFTKQVKNGYKPKDDDDGILDKNYVKFADKKPVKPDTLNPRNPVKEEYTNYQFQNQVVVIIQNPHAYPPVIPNLQAQELGLPNVGNTCFMNSVLQLILRKNHFIDSLSIFAEASHLIQLCVSLSQKLMLKQEIQREELINLKSMISQINPQFIGSEQQDSSEFLLCLLNQLKDDSSIYNNGFQQQQRFDDLQNQHHRIQQYLEQKHNQNFVFTNLIDIHFQTFFKCSKCSKTRYEFESQISLDINIPSGKDQLSVTELISSKISEIKMECQLCMKTTTHQKVILQLIKGFQDNKAAKIFDYQSKEIQKARDDRQTNDKQNLQKEHLEYTNRSYDFINQLNGVLTSFIGFVDHKGTEESGHYTAYYFTQQWHFYNDQQVQQCPLEVVYNILRNNQSAYNLLYELY